jgi:hypothetical protein
MSALGGVEGIDRQSSQQRGWVRGPAFDGFFLLSGLWLAPFALYIGATRGDPAQSPLDDAYLWFTALFWIAHRFSSTYLAYFTSAYRPLLKSQRSRFVWLPLALTAAVFLFVVPDALWPWPRMSRIAALAMLNFVLSAYHFAAQHYGVLSLYRIRSGQPRTSATKLIDRLFALGVGGALLFVVAAIVDTEIFRHVSPPWLGEARVAMQRIGTALVVPASAAMLLLEARCSCPSLPKAAYVLSVSLIVLCALWIHPFIYIVLWTVQHWTVATGLALLVAADDPEPGPSPWYRTMHFMNRRPWLLLLALIALSIVLWPVMESEALIRGTAGYAGRVAPQLVETMSAPGILPLLAAIGFASSFVHYHLDRAAFRFSNQEVRRAARGLLRP